MPAHLTLVPPVNVPQERYEDAFALLAGAASATQPFTVQLGAPATFLPDSPTLYLPVADEDRPALATLRTLLFREPLKRPLTWPFVPHITIGDDIPPGRIEAALIALRCYSAQVAFDRVHLLREFNHVWRPVADAQLRGEGAVNPS
jgi:2'-5' RNA ligase